MNTFAAIGRKFLPSGFVHFVRSALYLAAGRGEPRPDYELTASRSDFQLGSEKWLVLSERDYGGLADGIPVRKVSAHDPRFSSQKFPAAMRGGDRMSRVAHGYGRKYAKYMKPFVERDPHDPVTLVEVGILRGTGLAIWSDLFEHGRIYGLDIDLSHFSDNLPGLRGLGAFKYNNLATHEFDQYQNNTEFLQSLLMGRKIDLMIDDGMHTDEPILRTFASALPHLADHFVYFIEDNTTVFPKLKEAYPSLKYDYSGELTVVYR